jgi:CBS domain-containing protein
VHAALATMKQYRVRRLPVEGFGGTVFGIISMNDILMSAGARMPVRDAEVVDTLQAICSHHHPAPHVSAA